jgi:hypothetical protein
VAGFLQKIKFRNNCSGRTRGEGSMTRFRSLNAQEGKAG